MKLIIKIFFLAFLLTNCSTESKKRKETPINSLKDVMLNISPLSATFEINASEENFLKGEKGTVIFIPANAFQLSNGKTPSGKILVELKECYSLSEMISENLSTISDNQILETGGMINITAKFDGEELTLKKDKAIVIGFPKNNSKDTMDLFYNYPDKNGNTNWVIDYKVFEKEAIVESLKDSTKNERDNLDLKYPIEMTDDLYDNRLYSCGFTSNLWDLKLKGEKQDTTLLKYMENPRHVSEKITRKFIANNWRVSVEFNIDKSGKIYNIVPAKDDDLAKYDNYSYNLIKDIIAKAPAFDLNLYKDTLRFDWEYYYSIMGSKEINWDRFKERFRGQFSEYKNKAIQQLDKTALDYYMFSATKLGWINCDRFWGTNEEKINFIVKVANPKDSKIQIVFEDINSIMNGTLKDGYYVFNNIPLNKKIKVIGISYQNGKPTLSLSKTSVKKESYILTNFKEFSLDELETALNVTN